VRPRRTTANASVNSASSATILRSASGSPDDRRQSIRLTVKVPPSKLREVTRQNEVNALQDVLGGGRVLDGPRSRRAATTRKAEKPRYAEYGESEIDEEEDEEEEEEEEAEDGEEDEDGEALNDFDEIGAEAEGGTDEDEDMVDVAPPKQLAAPKPPRITLKSPANTKGEPPSKPKLVVTHAQVGPVKSAEDQEMEDEEEAESSELSDDDDGDGNGEDEEADEEMEDEEDVEGEDEEMDDDGEGDSSDETPASGMATPDLTKLTKRQRGTVDEGHLLALDMAPQQRKVSESGHSAFNGVSCWLFKFFTDQEKAMKKDEHARKRKELTKRKIQEEKAAALNRLVCLSFFHQHEF
jgi:Ino eighty subunit 2